MTVRADERRHLARAVALAQAASRTASPNPGVGCVLVDGEVVVGEGATRPAGGPHAEAVALQVAGSRARGATAYVTLEPCAHVGRTPPCADALAAAGVARVVIVHPDPNPTARGGAERLRGAGVEVEGPAPVDDPIRTAVAAQLEGFLTSVALGRPHVTLKLAQTVDGALTAPDDARWLTGPAARTAVHRWRAACDAVLVGSGTVLADDPGLDVRHVPASVQPRAVVLDARLRTPPSARVARPGTLVLTVSDAATDAGHDAGSAVGPGGDDDEGAPTVGRPGDHDAAATTGAGDLDGRTVRRLALEDRGVQVLDVAPGAAGGVDLPGALRRLGEHGVTSVFAEPGLTLAEALVADQLVDRLVLHVAPQLGTGRPRRAVLDAVAERWRTERAGGAGTDLILHLVPVRSHPDADANGDATRPEPARTREAR